ncbi:hypothetical protein [Streptomyces sp. NPDC050704]|uniref:hypothetical protein n=1 Tax=Streptomyces sp. NPDC050704 TaxID=3157219 RepID=UPI0034410C68
MRVSATRAGSGRDPAPGLHEALGFLTQARKAIGDEYGSDDHLVHAALHLIDCTTDACALLADTDDLEAAREALAAARAAVVAATCAVRHVHDGLRSRTS